MRLIKLLLLTLAPALLLSMEPVPSSGETQLYVWHHNRAVCDFITTVVLPGHPPEGCYESQGLMIAVDSKKPVAGFVLTIRFKTETGELRHLLHYAKAEPTEYAQADPAEGGARAFEWIKLLDVHDVVVTAQPMLPAGAPVEYTVPTAN